MDMIQSIHGHFQAGQFVPREKIAIPDFVEVVIVITDRSVTKAESINENDATRKLKAVEALTGIIPQNFDFNLDDVRQERIERRGLVE